MREPEPPQRKSEHQVAATGTLYDLIDSKSQEQERLIQQLRKSESAGLRISLYLNYVRREQEEIKSLHKVIAELKEEL